MLFVLLSHFLEAFFPNPDWFDVFLGDITDIASPTFVLISGSLIGFLYRVRPDAFPQLRTKLIDRGLFLLTIGHVVLLGGHYAMTPTMRWLPITDAVGFSMLISPWLVSKFGRAQRVFTGLAVFAINWLVVALWSPAAGAEAVKETFFGSQDLRFYAYAFPLIPWFCVDLIATTIGDRLGELYVQKNIAAVGKLLDRLWVGGVLSAMAVAVGLKVVSMMWPVTNARFAEVEYGMRAVQQRIPPGPVYILFYGGLGLLLLRLSFAAEQRVGRWVKTYVDYASAVGQVSLFTFVWQYYVYYTGIHLLQPYMPFDWAAPAYFAATVWLVMAPALWWHRNDYNKYITVGYSYFVRTRQPKPEVERLRDQYGNA